MEMIQRSVKKLSLLGAEVLEYNSFSILYKVDEEIKLLRYVNKKGRLSIIEEEGITSFQINEHFTFIKSNMINKGLYTKYCAGSLTRSQFITITSFDIKNKLSFNLLCPNAKVILLENAVGQLFVFNYKGKKLDITPYKREDNQFVLGIIYDCDTNRYVIGYGNETLGWNNYMSLMTVSKFRYSMLDVDDELSMINYHMTPGDR